MDYATQLKAQSNAIPSSEIKGTAVDSINANLESMTSRIETLARFASRISDGILGVSPEDGAIARGAPTPVIQSTQDHIRALEGAFERLSAQINRLG